MLGRNLQDAWHKADTFVRRSIQHYRAGLHRSADLSIVAEIQTQARELGPLSDSQLRELRPASRREAIAQAVAACRRVLQQDPHDVQVQGALAMATGNIAEMQTGEGKTMSAVLAVHDLLRTGRDPDDRTFPRRDPDGYVFSTAEDEPPPAASRVHVLTVNDYLAQRDAEWMGPVYRLLGHSVGFVTQLMPATERRAAYASDVCYGTPNEAGFDFLRDQLALSTEDLVLPEFHTVLIDEADSILIDEARIPLVIAGGHNEAEQLARQMDRIARTLVFGRDFFTDQLHHNVRLTDFGVAQVERITGIANLYEAGGGGIETLGALEAALHAHVLIRRDIDYIVRNGGIELVDEFKGRVAENRRWPAGLQTALEAKEGLPLRRQGRVLGSITLQNLVRMYPRRCGMTGTAATEAHEFREFYGLEVVPIETDRPVLREDHEDFVFPTKRAKEQSVITAIARMHATGRPVLVGTASVAESERLSSLATAAGIPHNVLNARQDAEEARIISEAGQRGAVTISTNMAGRGTDIRLGEGVAELGGLHVIGTNRHESRRIDNQLRGRAGRQGDPGSSRFYVSLQDDLLIRHGIANWSPDAFGIEAVQRVVEGQMFELRKTLWKYDGVLEGQRREVHLRRRRLLEGRTLVAPSDVSILDWQDPVEGESPNPAEQGGEPANPQLLLAIDELWAEYLASIKELREGIHWRAWGGREPFQEFIRDSEDLFDRLLEQLESLSAGQQELGEHERGATWTYVMSDQPWGSLTERYVASVHRQVHELMEGR